MSEDFNIDGYHIPAGTFVRGNLAAVMRDPSNFAEPDKFIPERFLQGFFCNLKYLIKS